MQISQFLKALTLCWTIGMALPAVAEEYPSRPIKFLVGFAAGGATDLVARMYAQQLQQVLKQSVIVDNRPGASELRAVRGLQPSPPDGYTLFFGAASSLSIGPSIRQDLGYDPLKDFTLIALVAVAPGVLFVHPDLPVTTLDDLVRYAKDNPGKLNYASAGIGSSSHLQSEFLWSSLGVSITHIPYKATNESTQAVATGSVHVGLAPPQLVVPMVADGKLRAISIAGAQRLQALPAVPTLAESGHEAFKAVDGYTFYGLVGPAGMRPEVVRILNDAINKASSTPALADRLRESLSVDAATGSSADFAARIRKEMDRWRELGKSVKLD